MGQFCDAGLNSAFTKLHLYIYDRSTIFLQGKRQSGNGMWYVDLQSQKPIPMSPMIQQSILGTIPEINNVYELGKKEDIITFLSQAMWNPVPQTWIKAIHSNFFATCPGLTAELVQKNVKENIEKQKDTCNQTEKMSDRPNYCPTKNAMKRQQQKSDTMNYLSKQ